MNVEQKRRELFEVWAAKDTWLAANEEDMRLDEFDGGFMGIEVHSAWVGFQAALDLVEIELPSDPNEEFCDRRAAIEGCRAAIESTGLGLKVKP